jgi:hypothetical protein
MMLYIGLLLYRDIKPANALLDELVMLLWLYAPEASA